ncbi:aldolase catalytic domain-containing protein [Camelliibacillus cellulosilyticus]|uniref:Aldolase catalytic domain-containing protein n=1 Tax=Camelliibacillus cellulosilyticus TaxID=2174486 RepID=A0ABV9GSS2_9BACL
MNAIQILDCTLRDGGYINDWRFGEKTIKAIVSKLAEAGIDIIECGFLRDGDFDRHRSLFNNVTDIRKYIAPKRDNTMYVAMIDQPYIPAQKIGDCDGTSIDGIRITFHEDEKEIEEAITLGKQLMDKGYKVFIQPVGTTSYSDEKLLNLIKKVNRLKPYAFYLVDTLGVMYKNDLLRLFHLLDHNLNPSIRIGFHSHNNLQLSFANAQELLSLHTKRRIIIDASVFGMGRGAGNLCTELLTQYINKNIKEKYMTLPLLEIVDEYMSPLDEDPKWGYSIPYYLAAVNQCHPNYASYLLNKQTITVKSIHAILKQLPMDLKDRYKEDYIEDLYIRHQEHDVDDRKARRAFKDMIGGRDILILAPGKSMITHKKDIDAFIREKNPFIISINFVPEAFPCHTTFFSNYKRYKKLVGTYAAQVVCTSNVVRNDEAGALVVNYSDLLLDDTAISDNAGLMLIQLLSQLSVTSVHLAGFDGFGKDKAENYFSKALVNHSPIQNLMERNNAIRRQLRLFERKMAIDFVTDSAYLPLGEAMAGSFM